MSVNNSLIKRALFGSAAMLITTGLAVPALAGEILTDFTMNTAPNLHGSVLGAGLTTAVMLFQLPSTPVDYSDIDLEIQGYRTDTTSYDADRETGPTHEDPEISQIQLNRNANGLGVCAEYETTYDHGTQTGPTPAHATAEQENVEAGCGGQPAEEAQVDNFDTGPGEMDEGVLFSISDDFYFAIREVTFGSIGADDDAIMYFGDPESFIWMEIDEGACDPATGQDQVCTVDLFTLWGGAAASVVNSDEYWAAFDHFNSNYFNFTTNSTLGANDDWFLRSANWVVDDRIIVDPDPLPEPMTLTLLGAGLMGAAFMRRRRA